MANILKKLYNTDKRELKKFEKYATKVEEHADEMSKLSDEQLQAKTPEFRERIKNGESLDDLLPEAFALLVKVQSVYQGFTHSTFKFWVVLHYTLVISLK